MKVIEKDNQENEVSSNSIGNRSKKSKQIIKVAILVIIGLFIFNLGIAIGDGSISFSSYSPISGQLPSSLNYASVNQVYQALKANYDGKLTTTELLNGIKHGLANAPGDPYTEYFTPKEARQFNNQVNNSFSGIGAVLGQNSQKEIEIMSALNGSPAAKAGLQAKDIITAINNVSTNGLSITAAASKIRGQAGTKVMLTVLRNNNQKLTFHITRQTITIPSVNTKIINGNIGYIQITTFGQNTSSLALKAANQFVKDHVKGIILDLRNDPGGLLQAAINISSLWLPHNKMVLQEKRGSRVIATYDSNGNDMLHNIPTVVLINSGSASASEITTGALHDNGQAYVIGQKSYGKGVVQKLINFGNGSELKVTIASWYRPDGKNINHLGIKPDMFVPLTQSDISAGNDTQLKAAEQYLSSH